MSKLFNTNGYREWAITRANKTRDAQRTLATYRKALESGVNFDGTRKVTEADAAWLRGEIAYWEAWEFPPFRPGEW